MTTLLTGGTGFVGKLLITQLDHVTVTSRNRTAAQSRLPANVDRVIGWQPTAEPLPLEGQRFDSIVNLMGEPIAEGRWSDAKKKRIRDSRVVGTRNLVDAFIAANQFPQVLISASAIGWYGDSGEDEVTEDHEPGTGFLTDICTEWEAEAMRLADHGVRVVCLRVGVVLGQGGGALKKLLPLFRWGLAGRLGSGQQLMSWIHQDDLVALIQWAIQTDSVSGPLNATAPHPVRNLDFTRALAAAVHRPALLPAPKFAVRLALGEFADSLFYSQRVIPEQAVSNGFAFQFPNIQDALKEIVS